MRSSTERQRESIITVSQIQPTYVLGALGDLGDLGGLVTLGKADGEVASLLDLGNVSGHCCLVCVRSLKQGRRLSSISQSEEAEASI